MNIAHGKRGNRTLSHPKQPPFRQIILQESGHALSGSLDRIERFLHRLAGFKPLPLEFTVQNVIMRSRHGRRICLFWRKIGQENGYDFQRRRMIGTNRAKAKSFRYLDQFERRQFPRREIVGNRQLQHSSDAG